MAWTAGTRPTAPTVKRPAIRRSGSRALGVKNNTQITSGPLVEEFGIPFDSQSERFIYWAMFHILGPPRIGVWRYQDPVIAGPFEVARIDFVAFQGERRLAIRIQTERYHYGLGSDKQAYDIRQKLALTELGWIVIDIAEEAYLHDVTGVAALVVTKKALLGIEELNGITAATSSARTARAT